MNADFQPTEQQPRGAAAGDEHPGSTPRGWISHTQRYLERWVGWSIAVYTAWLALVAFSHVPGLWFFALYAGLIGKWAEMRPARSQAAMATRGALLVAGASGLFVHAGEVGGPGGPFFFWLSITCISYAFMLRPAWSAGLVGFALLAFGTASWADGTSTTGGVLAHGGFLLIFPLLLGMRFGAEMRRPDEALESGRIDTATAIYNKSGLDAYGDQLLAQCQGAKRPLSVAVFDCSDLLEVRSIYGNRTARQVTARVVQKFNALATERGLAARTGPAEFTVVLPGLGREKALAAIERVLGRPGRIEFDAGDSEIVLIPAFTVQTSGPDTTCVDQLHRELRGMLDETKQLAQRRHDHMQRSRERHSRPMGLGALAVAHTPQSRRMVHIAPTLPAPFAAH